MAEDEEWRKMADTQKMKPEDVKAAGVEGSKRPPGHNPGGVLHQRGLNTVKK
ncbi:Transmembrane protein [Fagus crenata]